MGIVVEAKMNDSIRLAISLKAQEREEILTSSSDESQKRKAVEVCEAEIRELSGALQRNERLAVLQDRLIHEQQALRQEIKDLARQRTGLTSIDLGRDSVDKLQQDELMQANHSANSRKTARLKLVCHALNRIEAEEYGTCTACGIEVPIERLESNPAAEKCSECQSMHELKASRYAQ